MQRYGQIIKIKKEKIQKYKNLHAKPYEGVCEILKNVIYKIIPFICLENIYLHILNMWVLILKQIWLRWQEMKTRKNGGK